MGKCIEDQHCLQIEDIWQHLFSIYLYLCNWEVMMCTGMLLFCFSYCATALAAMHLLGVLIQVLIRLLFFSVDLLSFFFFLIFHRKFSILRWVVFKTSSCNYQCSWLWAAVNSGLGDACKTIITNHKSLSSPKEILHYLL